MSDPKMGRKMQPVTTAGITDAIAERLPNEPIKTIARRIGSNPYTVKNWKTGRNAPSLLQAILLARDCPDIRAWLKQMIEPPGDEQLERDYREMMRRIEAMEKQLESDR